MDLRPEPRSTYGTGHRCEKSVAGMGRRGQWQSLRCSSWRNVQQGDIKVTSFLEVEDTGIGMEPEVAERLFEPFRQASEGWSREYEGTGVGLAVTKKATEQMGGSIEVETQKGEGSRFTARLPKEKKDGEATGS
jgi:signal transduction histidine kinase